MLNMTPKLKLLTKWIELETTKQVPREFKLNALETKAKKQKN